MAESVQGYPKWQGSLSKAPRFGVIAWEEARKIYRDRWTGYAFMVFIALALVRFASSSTRTTTIDQLTDSLKYLEWGALAVTAVAAGPALLDDKRDGALELYYARGVTRTHYVVGKALAVWGIAFGIVLAPSLLYFGSALLTTDNLPTGFGWSWLGLVGHAAIWGTVVSGLGLALSAVLRSSRGAALVLFGTIFGIDVVLSNVLALLTKDEKFQIISPIADLHQQNVWLFPGAKIPYAHLPYWWSLLVLGGLVLVGWGVVAWRHPRLRGVE